MSGAAPAADTGRRAVSSQRGADLANASMSAITNSAMPTPRRMSSRVPVCGAAPNSHHQSPVAGAPCPCSLASRIELRRVETGWDLQCGGTAPELEDQPGDRDAQRGQPEPEQAGSPEEPARDAIVVARGEQQAGDGHADEQVHQPGDDRVGAHHEGAAEREQRIAELGPGQAAALAAHAERGPQRRVDQLTGHREQGRAAEQPAHRHPQERDRAEHREPKVDEHDHDADRRHREGGAEQDDEHTARRHRPRRGRVRPDFQVAAGGEHRGFAVDQTDVYPAIDAEL